MTAPFRFLAWLVLPALMSCSFNLLAATAEGAPQALHLLDYIGADYPPTVEAGKVIDESEYREQLEFLGVLQGLVAELPQRPEQAALVKGVDELLAAVTAHQEGATVARQARQLGAQLAVAYEVSQAPAITPDPTRGAPLYAQHCSVCHGTAGAGDGPASVGMTPAPANLRDATRLDHLSLYAIYSTLGLGVEGTDMPSFADQLDDRQRWDLATYIASFTAEPADPQRSAGRQRPSRCRHIPRPACATAAGQAWPGAIARLHRRDFGQEPCRLPQR
jgi:high-affinity iron transporter